MSESRREKKDSKNKESKARIVKTRLEYIKHIISVLVNSTCVPEQKRDESAAPTACAAQYEVEFPESIAFQRFQRFVGVMRKVSLQVVRRTNCGVWVLMCVMMHTGDHGGGSIPYRR